MGTTMWITDWSIWRAPSTTGARSRRSSTSRPRCSASLPISSTTPLTRSATRALMAVRSSDPLVLTLVTVTRRRRRIMLPLAQEPVQVLELALALALPQMEPHLPPAIATLELEILAPADPLLAPAGLEPDPVPPPGPVEKH